MISQVKVEMYLYQKIQNKVTNVVLLTMPSQQA